PLFGVFGVTVPGPCCGLLPGETAPKLCYLDGGTIGPGAKPPMAAPPCSNVPKDQYDCCMNAVASGNPNAWREHGGNSQQLRPYQSRCNHDQRCSGARHRSDSGGALCGRCQFVVVVLVERRTDLPGTTHDGRPPHGPRQLPAAELRPLDHD